MNKILALLAATLITAPAFAGTMTIVSDDSAGDLVTLPEQLIGILYDSGVKPQEIAGNKFVVEAKDIHCDYRHRGAWEPPFGGIPTTTCRLNSEDKQDSKKGKLLRDSRSFVDLLSPLGDKENSNFFFFDCAMGYCGGFVKRITCTIDANKESFHEGMFSCTLDDGLEKR